MGDRKVDLPVCGVFELAPDGRIQPWRDYFDVAQFSGASTPAGT
jgi:limonene-1,2-epoxide hydrolase